MLQVSNISKRYGDVRVLRDVSFKLSPNDHAGLIGPNGCGKTTLLRILVGAETAGAGSVQRNPPTATIGYLEQGLIFKEDDTLDTILRHIEIEMEKLEDKIALLGVQLSIAQGENQDEILKVYGEALSQLEALSIRQIPMYQAEDILDGLGLGTIPLETPVKQLSGGQKTRLGLARILLANPDMLILDEPTNHLDIRALEWLEDWIQRYKQAIIIVSHDRTFLDRTVNVIFDLDPLTHSIQTYPGNYSDYIHAKQNEINRHWEAYNAQQERIEKLQGESRRLSGYANSIEHGTIDFAPRKVAKGIARRATVQRKRIERELAEEHIEKPRQTWHMKLDFIDTPLSGNDVLICDELSIGYGSQPLVTGINQIIQQGERIALIGPNGCGKTTFMRTVANQLSPISGFFRLGENVSLGYFSQEQENLPPSATPFSVIRAVASISDTDIRSFLHFFLFSGDDVFLPIHSLSYGERARLVLARLVASDCNLLLLDEPINHLDIPSRSGFEQAMTAFEGTVLTVVHDRYFIRNFATRLWVIENGTLSNYLDLDEYKRLQDRRS
ncbi:MAG: ABC-F family ATP-binding cassette domain-containing protein [Anaerolineales bacterium]|nr:MAG: ABC-F family ATP-binding cassette domain-containing protein [Anaerolineales bacterium]